MYVPRYLEETIQRVLRTFKVLYVGGPRQVGKTTLLLHLAKKAHVAYVSLDDLAQRKLAREDPALFLDQFATPLFIDEVQYAPELFPVIKLRVDRSTKRGQYWLTGSQQFAVMKHVRESLAGRVGIVSLLGFSLAERAQYPLSNTPFLPQQTVRGAQVEKTPMAPRILFTHILRGSFPTLTQRPAPSLDTFYNSYLQTYLDRDLRELFHVGKISAFHTFLQLCAARTGQLLNYSDLARDAGISVHAAREWVSILEQGLQIYLLHPYFPNVAKRLIKTPKLYFLDTGLAAFLTKWKTAETLMSGAMAGAFFETFVVSEIVKSYLFRGLEPPLYYLRDKEGHEIDCVIAREGKLYPIEIKLSSRVTEDMMRGMRYWRKKLRLATHGAIITAGNARVPLDREHTMLPAASIA